MNRLITLLFLVAIAALPSDGQAVIIPTVPVGKLGNANDSTGFGAVAYAYNIGTTEVTNAQYVAFLNEKAKSDPLGLYSASMGTNARGGITQSGVSGSFTYATRANMGDKPVNYVSWYDSIRFANWLNNGQGMGDTESGAYTILGGTEKPDNGNNIIRNLGAKVFVPSQNEWYKAAYYNPAMSSYFQYPTSTNTVPIGSSPTALANHANYNNLVGNLTNVGAYTGTTSLFGAFDMAGNVWEWTEGLDLLDNGISRGGSFGSGLQSLSSSGESGFQRGSEAAIVGFRVATIPEPSSLALAAFGFAGLAAWGWRRKR